MLPLPPRYVLTAENPLPTTAPVDMGSLGKGADEWYSCDSKFIRVNELCPFGGSAEATFEIEYRPLLPTTQPTEHLLTILTQQLGVFKYKIIVSASVPSLRQILRFEIPLGSIQTENFILHTYNQTPTTFNCTVKKPDFFSVPKTFAVEGVQAWEGEDQRIGLTFEPTEIGEVKVWIFKNPSSEATLSTSTVLAQY